MKKDDFYTAIEILSKYHTSQITINQPINNFVGNLGQSEWTIHINHCVSCSYQGTCSGGFLTLDGRARYISFKILGGPAMNNARRKKLQKIYDQLEELKEKLDFIIEDEQTALDNMPESMWETERYENMESGLESLEDVQNSFDTFIMEFSELLELMTAQELIEAGTDEFGDGFIEIASFIGDQLSNNVTDAFNAIDILIELSQL